MVPLPLQNVPSPATLINSVFYWSTSVLFMQVIPRFSLSLEGKRFSFGEGHRVVVRARRLSP